METDMKQIADFAVGAVAAAFVLFGDLLGLSVDDE